MNNRLVIIGANDFQNQLIKKAKTLGFETHVFAWEDGAVGKKSSDYFYPISITEKEEILEKCREINPCGVCSIASDLASITVNYIAENLGLPCNNTKYTEVQTNKYKMREALRNAELPCPNFVIAEEGFDSYLLNDFQFPIIVKPTDRSGSRSVTKLESVDGLNLAIKDACKVSFEKKAIIEEFIDGDEYSMETISFKGNHRYLATTKKFTTGAPRFIETGHIEPSGLPPKIIDKAKQIVFYCLNVLHIENGAAHSEFKVNRNGDIRIIEIGARMGGDCIGSDLVYLSTGNDFMKMVIDVACGKEPMVLENPKNTKVEIRFLFSKDDLEELEKKKITQPESIYRISEIDFGKIEKAIDSSTRAGYYILR